MKWILIVMFANGGFSVGPFDNKPACEYAALYVKALYRERHPAVCLSTSKVPAEKAEAR